MASDEGGFSSLGVRIDSRNAYLAFNGEDVSHAFTRVLLEPKSPTYNELRSMGSAGPSFVRGLNVGGYLEAHIGGLTAEHYQWDDGDEIEVAVRADRGPCSPVNPEFRFKGIFGFNFEDSRAWVGIPINGGVTEYHA